MNRKKIFRIALCLFLLVITGIFICNMVIKQTAAGKTYSDINTVPSRKTGLLLGTSKYNGNGTLNPFFELRIKATVELIKAGKIKYIIVSGDNSTIGYNEPAQMRSDLIAAGIDSTIIYLDYAGFRTFDSVVRLKEIFGQDSVTFISQRFHNERAIYLATMEGIDAIGFNAKDVSKKAGLRTQMREKLARVKVFIDLAFGKKPKFLGQKISVP